MSQQTQTSISGNNTSQAGIATTARAVATDYSKVFHVVVALILVIFGVTLAGQNLSFFWKLVTGIGLIIVGGKLALIDKKYAKYKGAWPSIIRSLGWAVIATTLLLSGLGQWTGSVAKSVNEKALCAVEENRNKPECIAKTMREEAEANAKAQAEAAARAEQERLYYLRQQEQAQAEASQAVPSNIEVFCQDTSHECGVVPSSPEEQRVIVQQRSNLCVGIHYEPATEVARLSASVQEITYKVPPHTKLWRFYLKRGERFEDIVCS